MRSVVEAVGSWALGTAGALRHVDGRWLAAGLVLHLVAEAIRQRGWWTILRAAYPDAHALRVRDVLVAYLGGGGLNSVIPARGGDLVKLGLLRRRVPDARFSTLAVTLVPETFFECLMGAALVAWAMHANHVPIDYLTANVATDQLVAAGAVVAVAVLALGVLAVRRRDRLIAPLKQGLAVVGTPGRFITGVAFWQALARPVRLLAIMSFLAAFEIVATPAAALTAMAVGGAGRIRVPGVGIALRAGALAYAMPHATHGAVDAGQAVAFSLGMQLFFSLTAPAISLVILTSLFGVHSPRRAMREARSSLRTLRADTLAESPEAPLARPL